VKNSYNGKEEGCGDNGGNIVSDRDMGAAMDEGRAGRRMGAGTL